MFLSVKRIVVEQVGAVELLAMGLAHSDDVFFSFEYLNLEMTNTCYLYKIALRKFEDYLICNLWSTSSKVIFSFYRNFSSHCSIFSLSINFDCFIIICVLEDDIGNPKHADLKTDIFSSDY